METNTDFKHELAQFTGTENYYKGFMGVLRTDGVQFFSASASWLITDMEAVFKTVKPVMNEEFIAVRWNVKNHTAIATYTDGNDNVLFSQSYEYADLENGEYLFFYTNNVLMLSGEY